MKKIFQFSAGISGFLLVLLGALSSHYLSNDPHLFDIAWRYHAVHTLALLFLIYQPKRAVGFFWILGLIFFSATIYLKAFLNIDITFLTPIGGISFMLGWLILAINFKK